jgi:glutathione synthase/RimK-type ligase-like ATP-grasp enzyme
MNQVVTIKTKMDQHSEFAIHPEKAAAIGLGNKKFAYISFGNQKYYAKIILNPEVPPENAWLSRNLSVELHLPEYPIYEIRLNHNEILIGPYIGLLLANEDRRLTSVRLNKLLVYGIQYAKLHGAMVVFALDKVHRENRLIEGYGYNPAGKCWQKGIYPYPAAIYRTIGLNPEWKNHFLSVIGDKVFNSRFFGKWEMYQWFVKEPEINPHLPYTVLYHSPQDVFEMLARFPRVYIKPVLGLQGRGIVRAGMENKVLILKYREKGVNCVTAFEDPAKAREYIQERFRHGRYLIQQAVDLLEYQGRLIDFRCVVQKNQAGRWVCQAIIGRSGVTGSIVSNISSGGAAFTAENILRKAIPASAERIADWKEKIAALAITVSHKLDGYGINCGTLGLDIGMDPQGRLWLIEINNRDPDPGIALDVHDTQLYYTLKTGPLFYAKFLAGFQDE